MTTAEMVTVKEHVEKMLDAHTRLFRLWADDQERATALARESLDGRLEKLNELRQMVTDRDLLYVTKREYERTLEDIRSLRESRAEIAGKASIWQVLLGLLLSAIAIAVSMLK